VGIVALGSPFSRGPFQEGLSILKSWGLSPVVPPSIYSRLRYLAGPDDRRLEPLHAFFMDPGIKAVFCARGGYGALRLLDRIRFLECADTPKWVVGFSDNTVLLNTLASQARWVSLHGPHVSTLSSLSPPALSWLKNLLFGRGPFRIKVPRRQVLKAGQASGTLVGGNLTLLIHTLGTPFFPSLNKKILFLEERGEAPYRLDRLLTHLRLSGKLKGLSGLILGEFSECGPKKRVGLILSEFIEKTALPVVLKVPSGHTSPNYALPIGCKVHLDGKAGGLTFAF
jgi:muramoyltetrapeptide carboxypeptidase